MRQLLEVEKLAKVAEGFKEFRGHLAFFSKLNIGILLILVESPARSPAEALSLP